MTDRFQNASFECTLATRQNGGSTNPHISAAVLLPAGVKRWQPETEQTITFPKAIYCDS